MLEWEQDENFAVNGVEFQALAEGAWTHRSPQGDGRVRIFKSRALVDFYAGLVAELEPKRIFELGVWEGGSSAFFAALARPERLVGIDREPSGDVVEQLGSYSDAVRIFGNVNQRDRQAIARIVAAEFGDETLDLVIDDCSHQYVATRASFNELFPRLRAGGAFVIEDWSWAHLPADSGPPEGGMYPDFEPLSRLLLELVLAHPVAPRIIESVTVHDGIIVVRRGNARVEPAGFDVVELLDARGRALLADP